MKGYEHPIIFLINNKNKLIHIYSGLTLQQIVFSQNVEWPLERFNFLIPFPELKAITLNFMEKKMRYIVDPFSLDEKIMLKSLSFFEGISKIL